MTSTTSGPQTKSSPQQDLTSQNVQAPQDTDKTDEVKTVTIVNVPQIIHVDNSDEDDDDDEVKETINCEFCYKPFDIDQSKAEVCMQTKTGSCASCAETQNFFCSHDNCDCDYGNMYSCECGREVYCESCDKSFCRHNGNDICYSDNWDIPHGLCGRCISKNLKFECSNGTYCNDSGCQEYTKEHSDE